MKKIAKQILCAILLAVMMFSVVACAGQETSSRPDASNGATSDASDEVSEDPNAKYLDDEGRYVTT